MKNATLIALMGGLIGMLPTSFLPGNVRRIKTIDLSTAKPVQKFRRTWPGALSRKARRS